ncbi:MAG TPA: ATP-binding protein, partial [Polyangiales bacterium]|nr:ATP-binding protein [Polyangiales bacterium]
ETQNLVAFRYAMEEQFSVLTASSGPQALDILAHHEVGVMLADQRMPGMTGVQLCEAAQQVRPDTIRIIVTAYADLHAAIDAINTGQISRYMVKPWRNDELAEVLRTCIELVHISRTVRDMELRLLRGSQTHTAISTRAALLHEINNPLGALLVSLHHASRLTSQIHSRIDALSNAGTPSLAEELRQLQDLQESQDDALLAVEQLRQVVARMRIGDTLPPAGQSCDAGRIVDATVRILRRDLERSARLEVILSDSPLVSIDASALGQIVLNLLLNAAQAIEEAGVPGKVIRVHVERSDEHVVLRVADSGPGMNGEQLERLFEPHFTTRSGGSGLGLPIVRELAERAGGEVAVKSQLGSGTTVEVRLLPAT